VSAAAARTRASALTTSVALLAIFAAWEGAVRTLGVKPIVLPAPSVILAELAANLPWYLGHAWYTLITTLAGFAVAVLVGIALAVVIVESRLLESTVYALIVGLNSVPKVAVAPLFVVWLGTGYEPKIAIAFLIAVFAVVIDTVLGLRSVPADVLDLAHSLRGSRFDVLFRIRFPCALPAIFSGMKVAISLALVGAIVGEFVAGSKGLGFQILVAQGQFDTIRVFVSLLLLGVVGTVLFLFVDYAERLLLPWHVSQRSRQGGSRHN
jgi:NitT/TauT family transport system permease protein